jgi:predicted MPP superfamily phosphohydrolase
MKLFRFSTIFFLIVFFLSILYSQEFSAQELPRFAVISDIHFGNNVGEGPMVKVPNALKNLLGKGRIDALFVVGDLTDNGREEQYDRLLSVFNDKTIVPEEVAVYYLMGNHDNFNPNGQNVYLEKLKQPLNQYVEIKGYPFITLSQTDRNSSGSGENDYNAGTRQFLTEKLAQAKRDYPGKPVFVFMHVPAGNTCYGSTVEEGWGMDALTPILEQYPEVITFSGHSHFPLGDPRSIAQNKFTAVNDGSTTYSEVEENIVSIGIHPEEHENVTEGLIVNIRKNGDVEMERWDTYRNEEIFPRWLVEAPHNGNNFAYKNRNGLPAPVFPKGKKLKVDCKPDLSCTVTFPQAKETKEDVVHHYLVEIRDGDEVIQSYSVFSQYYLNSRQPKELSVTFSDLPRKKKLAVQVRAMDAYNNKSVPLSGKFINL